MGYKKPKIFPRRMRVLTALGERIRLARKRRRFSAVLVAERAGISRMTLSRAEKGAPEVSMGVYFNILSVLGLEKDFDDLAADDELGNQLRDLELK